MERFKLAAIKQLCTPDQMSHFNKLVISHLNSIDILLRACYNKFLDYDQATMAWIVAVDGCFLLNLLHSYVGSVDSMDKRLVDNTIITRDIMMVENQIPYLHLKEIRNCLRLCDDDDDDHSDIDNGLLSMLLDFCQLISPLKLYIDKSHINYEPLHVLDLLYHMIMYVPYISITPQRNTISGLIQRNTNSSSSSLSSTSSDSQRRRESEAIQERIETIMAFADTLGNKRAKEILKPVTAVSSIPWSSISGIFGQGTLHHGEEDSLDKEITIPSVAHLYKYANVKCRPIIGGINDIKFVEEDLTLYLPILSLNSTSEVILRNLVAYEAAMSRSRLEFARYINLMNGIIDTAEDVKLLRENGVIVNGSLRDEEIADLFNGMKRFYVKHSEKSHIEMAIDKVNEFYDVKLSVRVARRMKRSLYASWKCLAIVSTVVMFVVIAVQAFCQIYGCSRLWGGKLDHLFSTRE